MSMLRYLAGLMFALLLASPSAAQAPDQAPALAPGGARHVQAELVADRTSVAPGETLHVALRQRIETHWHTYWRNSGDSGQPTQIKWDLPAGWTVSDFTWPAPKKLPVGPLMN